MQKTGPSSGIYSLFQPQGGLFTSMVRAGARAGEPDFVTRIVRIGEMSELRTTSRRGLKAKHSTPLPSGAGTGLCDEDAILLGLAEALERYCTSLYGPDQFVWASANELGKEALDLDTIPKCSEAELLHPKCPLSAPDKKRPIRWVRGISLLDGCIVHIPAVMVYLNVGYATAAERFWLPTTTGCAVHYSYERALLNAILEVVERDAISTVWLQKLPLPRIEIDHIPPALAGCWERYQRASQNIECVFFDATTDLGIPTIYGLQISQAEKHLTSLVSCATSLEPGEAVAKVIRDMAALRIAFRNPRPVPASFDEFSDIFDGATYMARVENLPAFDFLLRNGRSRPLREMPRIEADLEEGLKYALGRFRMLGINAYAVDLSTDEAIRCGLRAARVIVPGLQPLSFNYRARYLGHRRLFEAPRSMGYPVHSEEQLNSWPQPFA